MTQPPHEHEARRRVDMSAEAIDRRLRELAQLHRLGMSLKKGRWIGPAEDSDRREA